MKLSIENPRKYDICFKSSFNDLPAYIKETAGEEKKAFIITDSNVAALYFQSFLKLIKPCFKKTSYYILRAGEESKNLKNTETVLKALLDQGFTRDDLIIAFGGGVSGDLAGFCAGIYMRGIDYIQVPTTLLSMVDSSIGGKTAVDMESYKNMIGVFHSPILVYENTACLKTLPREQFLSGMGEVIKSALIGDKDLWNFLLENKIGYKDLSETKTEDIAHILYRSCLVKKKAVDEDPFDTGNRAVLNFGHTVGHAIEKCSDFRLPHGYCVTLGTICALYISMSRGCISEAEYKAACEYIKDIGLYTTVPEELSLTKKMIMEAISKDKKNTSSGLKFILLEEIGKAAVKKDVTREEIGSSLNVIGIRK